jgi:hypothetical protein
VRVSPSVRLCLRFFLLTGSLMMLGRLTILVTFRDADDSGTALLREAALHGLVFAAFLTLIAGVGHVHAVRRLLGRPPTASELETAHNCVVVIAATAVEATALVRTAALALPGARMIDDGLPAGSLRALVRDAQGLTWGTHLGVRLVTAGSAHTVVVIDTWPRGPFRHGVDYGINLRTARAVAERLREHGPQPLRASA